MLIELDKKKYQNFYAHKRGGKDSETLIEHLNLTKIYLNRILKSKNLEMIIDELIFKIDIKYFKLIKKLFLNAIYLHDLGKTNPAFQSNKMNNPLFEETTLSSNHSMLGAELFVKEFKEEINSIKDDKEFYKILFIMYNFAYQISKHHGKLTDIESFFSDDVDFDKSYNIENYFEFYILNKLLFSLLVSSDYYATTEYMSDIKIDNFGLINQDKKETLIKLFEEDKIIKNIRANRVEGIDILRSQMFLEAQKNLKLNLDKHIFYLEAPTGSGKTLTSINLALTLLKSDDRLNKVFYVFPFNTLVEQTKGVFDKIFKDSLNIEVINSITPIKEIEGDYTKSYISRLFFHNELIITTHIALFNILFGTSKEDNFPLWQLANSVIILDEIQSYDNNLWSYMTKFFASYAKSLNIKIIIMSATLPKLDNLIEDKSNLFVDLISDKSKYFQDNYFRNRVEIDYSLLDNKKIDFDDLKDKLLDESQNYNKILFEFIKKQSAREFYNLIKDDYDFDEFEIYELSGDDNKAFRQKVINRTKEDIKIIIVATQVIEAGVDIDMDLGFKDISTLDSEEQFMGRVNRSCKKSHLSPKVYFFDMDNERSIYKDDNRIEFNLKNPIYQDILKNKDFDIFYQELLTKLRQNDKRIKEGILENFEAFEEDIKKLNYKVIKDKMRLIKSQNFRLYFPFALDIKEYNFEEFKDIDEFLDDNGWLDGQRVWEVYQDLNSIDGYAQKEIQRYKLNSLMQFFTFNIIKYSDKQILPHYSEEFGGYYYIQDWSEFIDEEGKFNREAYLAKGDSLFL